MTYGCMKYRKKPVLVDALRWTGANYADMETFLEFPHNGHFDIGSRLRIHTLKGTMTAIPGDWIVRGVAGEYYPVCDGIFQKTYEPYEVMLQPV